MKLIHFWIRDYHPFKDFQTSLSSRFESSIEINEEEKNIHIQVEKKEAFPKTFFPEGIANVTAFVGKNGVGKSRLLTLLCEILGDGDWYSLPEYLLVFYSIEKDRIFCQHNLYEKDYGNELPLQEISMYEINLSTGQKNE